MAVGRTSAPRGGASRRPDRGWGGEQRWREGGIVSAATDAALTSALPPLPAAAAASSRPRRRRPLPRRRRRGHYRLRRGRRRCRGRHVPSPPTGSCTPPWSTPPGRNAPPPTSLRSSLSPSSSRGAEQHQPLPHLPQPPPCPPHKIGIHAWQGTYVHLPRRHAPPPPPPRPPLPKPAAAITATTPRHGHCRRRGCRHPTRPRRDKLRPSSNAHHPRSGEGTELRNGPRAPLPAHRRGA